MAEPPRVYLDTCCIQRLTDDQQQERIRREAEAVRHILALWKKHEVSLLRSSVLLKELLATPDSPRRSAGLILVKDFLPVQVSGSSGMPLLLGSVGIRAFDAQHIAAAVAGMAAYFVTCDDGIIKRCREIERLCDLEVVSPPALLQTLRRLA